MNTKISKWEAFKIFNNKPTLENDEIAVNEGKFNQLISALESSIREDAYKEGYEQGRKDARASFISGGGASGYAGHGSCGAGGSDGNLPQ